MYGIIKVRRQYGTIGGANLTAPYILRLGSRIQDVEKEIPKDNPVQCYAFLFEGEIVGYSWIM